MARRYQALSAGAARLDAALAKLVTPAAPRHFLAKQGVATQSASTLLATAGDNPGRLRTEASFAVFVDCVGCAGGRIQIILFCVSMPCLADGQDYRRALDARNSDSARPTAALVRRVPEHRSPVPERR